MPALTARGPCRPGVCGLVTAGLVTATGLITLLRHTLRRPAPLW